MSFCNQILDNLEVGVIMMNIDKKCMYSNTFVKELLNTNETDGMCQAYMNKIHVDDIPNEMSLNSDFFTQNKNSTSEFRLVKDSKVIWIQITRTTIENYGFMFILENINKYKLLQNNLIEETKKAEQAYNHKSRFLANMSHEIRTPLNGIIGMLTLLEDSPLTNNQQEYINMIKECSYNLMTIINDILDFSKLEIGKIVLSLKPVNVINTIDSINDIILSKIYEKSIEYTFTIDPSVPECIVSDENRFKQILLNLLSNSIKFTDKGKIVLHVNTLTKNDFESFIKIHSKKKCVKTEDYDIFLRCDITDSGCGIDPTEQDKLFKSFSQVDNRLTSKVYQGTGLGLVISKELVELMNGCIWLEWSKVNNGSRFSFIIPTTESHVHINKDNNELDAILKNVNVLIVDDNIYNRISLIGIVSKWGMQAQAFSTSEEALYMTKIKNFDIGLIDICMPNINGIEFAKKLKEQKEFTNATIPLIALSSLGDKQLLNLNPNLFNDHLYKPIKESKLKKICISVLAKYKSNNMEIIIPHTIQQNLLISDSSQDQKPSVQILVAEDIYVNQRVIISFLEKLGYKAIDVVENGEQCLESIYSKQYDIVLLDIRMPVLDGESVLHQMNEYFKNQINKRKPYVIAVTAYSMREDKEKYLSMGFDDYIPKPVSLEMLNTCMEKFFQKLLNE